MLTIIVSGQCTTEIDEMTKQKIVSTGYQKVGKGIKPLPKLFFKTSFIKIDSLYFVNIIAEGSSAWSIDKNDIIYLKTEKDSIIKILNLKYEISTVKSGEPFSQGTDYIICPLSISELLDIELLKFLLVNKLTKIRVGIYDYQIIKPEIIQEQINCILSAK